MLLPILLVCVTFIARSCLAMNASDSSLLAEINQSSQIADLKTLCLTACRAHLNHPLIKNRQKILPLDLQPLFHFYTKRLGNNNDDHVFYRLASGCVSSSLTQENRKSIAEQLLRKGCNSIWCRYCKRCVTDFADGISHDHGDIIPDDTKMLAYEKKWGEKENIISYSMLYWTPLGKALYTEQLELVATMLAKCPHVTRRKNWILQKCVEQVVQFGLQPTIPQENMTVTCNRYKNILNLLRACQAKLNHKHLTKAVKEENIPLTHALLELGISPNFFSNQWIRSHLSITPLISSVLSGNIALIATLLKYKAKWDLPRDPHLKCDPTAKIINQLLFALRSHDMKKLKDLLAASGLSKGNLDQYLAENYGVNLIMLIFDWYNSELFSQSNNCYELFGTLRDALTNDLLIVTPAYIQHLTTCLCWIKKKLIIETLIYPNHTSIAWIFKKYSGALDGTFLNNLLMNVYKINPEFAQFLFQQKKYYFDNEKPLCMHRQEKSI